MDDATILARLAASGASQEMIEITRNNPQHMAQLRSHLLAIDTAATALEDPPLDFATLIKLVKERYEEDQRMTPYKVPAPAREQMLSAQRRDRQQAGTKGNATGSLRLQAFCGNPKSFSTVADLGSLQRVLLEDMLVPKTHKGQYLLCRTISQPILKVGLTIMIEDQLGRVEQLGLYNLPLGNMVTGVELDSFIPLGSVIAVKEPTYNRAPTGPTHLICADSPTDVVFLTPFDPIARDADWTSPSPASLVKDRDYKAEGNAHFAKPQYRHADKIYSEGIASAPASDLLLLLHLNRAAARLHIDQPRGAHRDALQVLSILDSNAKLGTPSLREKALVRRARAEEDMRLNEEALVSYDAALQHAPNNEQAVEGKKRAERKLAESRTGNYDWIGIFKAALDVEKNPRQDVGDFVGPIRIGKAAERGGGRGIFATRAIKAGELLLVEKAFAAEYPDPRRPVISINLVTKHGDLRAQPATVTSIMAKLMDDGTLDQVVHSLYAGPHQPAPGDVPEQPYSNLGEDKTVCIDPARIEDVCTYNCFGYGGRGAGVATAPQVVIGANEVDPTEPSLLVIRGSLFNHSCAHNADWQTYSDVFVVRARAPIAEGAEVFIHYTNSGHMASMTGDGRKVLSQHFPTGCSCDLCAAERCDGPARVARRRELMGHDAELKGLVNRLTRTNGLSVIRHLEQHLADVNATYSPERGCGLRLTSAHVYYLLANAHTKLASFDDAISHTFKGLEASGCIIRPSPLTSSSYRRSNNRPTVLAVPVGEVDATIIQLIVNAKRSDMMGKAAQTREWLRLAMDAEEIYNGGGKEKFRLRCEELMKEFKLERLFESM